MAVYCSILQHQTCRFAGELPSPTSRKVRRFCLLAARTHPCTLAGPRGAEPSNPPMLGGLGGRVLAETALSL